MHKKIIQFLLLLLCNSCVFNTSEEIVQKDVRFDSLCKKNLFKRINESMIYAYIGKPDTLVVDSVERSKKYYYYFNTNQDDVNTGSITIDSTNKCTCGRVVN